MTKKIIIEINDEGIVSSTVQLEKISNLDCGLFIIEFETIKLQLLQMASKGRTRTY